jgi:hypothetical protein
MAALLGAAPIAAGQGAGGEVWRPLGKFQSLKDNRLPVYSAEEEVFALTGD